MKLCFIGMSGCGKSYWSQKLGKEHGYTRLSCDEEIERTLLKNNSNESRISAEKHLSDWLGQPFSDNYADREAEYLAAEEAILKSAVKSLLRDESTGNTVIDTSGSAVYLPENLLEEIKRLSVVVYLDVTEEVLKSFIENYFRDPKPVIWLGNFSKKPSESNEEALRSSYPRLLNSRRKMYMDLADIVIPYNFHRSSENNASALINYITGNQDK